MAGSRLRPVFFVGLFLSVLAVTLPVQGEKELDSVPSEDLCRPYIEKALKDLGTGSLEQTSGEVGADEEGVSREEGNQPAEEKEDESTSHEIEDAKSSEAEVESATEAEDVSTEEKDTEGAGDNSQENVVSAPKAESAEDEHDSVEEVTENAEAHEEDVSEEKEAASKETIEITEEKDEVSEENAEGDVDSTEKDAELEKSEEDQKVDDEKSAEETVEIESEERKDTDDGKSNEEKNETAEDDESKPDDGTSVEETDSKQDEVESNEVPDDAESAETEMMNDEEIQPNYEDDSQEAQERSDEADGGDSKPETLEEIKEDHENVSGEDIESTASGESQQEATSKEEEEIETVTEAENEKVKSRVAREAETEPSQEKTGSQEVRSQETASQEAGSQEAGSQEAEDRTEADKELNKDENAEEQKEEEPTPEEDLIQEIDVPENLRPREHINQLLKLDEENEEKERGIEKAADIILRDLKKVYDNAIKPLETVYKYRDLSNRHFGDPEIFSKPLVLFMGPWSGGKSSIINYLVDIEYKHTSLRTGAEPSPAYFNILMHGEEEEILDGTQLAADWTFSGLQKFGQGMLDRLRGLKLNNKLLEKVNIVEIPGILEIRKQVQRLFPFNDACQWFIDRADIIFLVYDPSKLDVGPETEAILDQLKGREYQTRIILNKADQVKPEELMRVQGALIWNISPLMSSAEPPIMYSTSLWSLPYEAGAPTRLLYAQERAFLRDLRSAIDKRVEHKIASARRFAVRVRNHAKMVDCYLTTYYNHKTFFGNKKDISDKIIENPQDYHIYEGLSTLTNISRYDLPDPDVYRDFFRLNSLYDFPLLSSTCTYFRGCPINRLDIAIAYDLPELVGKYKKSVEAVVHESETSSPPS